MTQSKVSFHHVLYTKSPSKVQSWCFFTQNVSNFINEGKSTYEDFKCGLIKQPLGLFLFFLFVTGKCRTPRYQVKQDKLKTPQVVE